MELVKPKILDVMNLSNQSERASLADLLQVGIRQIVPIRALDGAYRQSDEELGQFRKRLAETEADNLVTVATAKGQRVWYRSMNLVSHMFVCPILLFVVNIVSVICLTFRLLSASINEQYRRHSCE